MIELRALYRLSGHVAPQLPLGLYLFIYFLHRVSLSCPAGLDLECAFQRSNGASVELEVESQTQ